VLYSAAFVAMLASAYALYKGAVESSLTMVWISIGLAGAAIVLAVAVVLLPHRR
jgi:hypothetical protein